MSNRKTKPLTERGHLGFNNSINNLEVNAIEYKKSINSFLLTKELSSYVGRFKYENLPKGITPEIIETMLYYKGQLALFKVGAKFYILPFVYTGTLNHYGVQEQIIPIPFNGTIENDKNVVSFAGTYKAILFDEAEDFDSDDLGEGIEGVAVILRERSSLMFGSTLPTIVLTDELRNKLAENVLLVRNNLILSHPIKYVSMDSQDKATSVGAQMAQMFNSILEGKLVQTVVGHLDFKEMSSNPPTIQVQQLWQNYSSLDALRLSGLGIVNNGTFEKRERILTDEIEGKQSESKLVLQDHLRQRQLWASLANKHFEGLNITVDLSDDLKNKDLDILDNREGSKTKVGYEDEE